MKWRLLLLFACSTTCMASAFAQLPNQNFPEIPENHWAYEDIAQFERAGLVARWLPQFGRGRPESRGEFASRIAFCFEKLAALTETIASEREAAARPGQKDPALTATLQKHLAIAAYASRWRDPVHRLIKEFAPELRYQDIDCDSLLLRFDGLISICLSSKVPPTEQDGSTIAVPVTHAPALFADVPDNHWAYEAMFRLTKHGLIANWPSGLGYFKTPSRVDFATRTEYCVNTILDLSAESTGDLQRDRNAVADVAQEREAVDQLIGEFAPELVALGKKPTNMLRDLDAAIIHCELALAKPVVGQFADVPAGHWAAQATLDLRRAGILVGYPDGKFRG